MSAEEVAALDALEFYRVALGAPRASADAIYSVFVKSSLAKLFYPVDLTVPVPPDDDAMLSEAIMLFEQAAGFEEDGLLTVEEFKILGAAASEFGLTRIYGPIFHVAALDGFVSAVGTWVIDDDQIAYPANSAKINCSRATGIC